MPAQNLKFSPHHHSQHCTPDHWATYYIMTLYNMGAFDKAFLERMDPDAFALRGDLIAWTAAALKRDVEAHPLLAAELRKPNGPFTRAELAAFITALLQTRAGGVS